MDKFYNIAHKSCEIAEKIGNPIIESDYYSNYVIGHKYEYDNLKIELYKNNNKCYVYVYINDIKLLYCNFSTKEITYTDGSWSNIIDIIHQQIPSIVNERKKEEENKKRKIRELKSLEELFKYYITCANSKPDVLKFIKSELEKHDISISKEASYIKTSTNFSEYDSYWKYYIYSIYESEEKVAEFKDNVFDIFPNINYYVEQYKPGKWTTTLENTIRYAKYFDEELTQKEIDNSVDQIIRKLTRNS